MLLPSHRGQERSTSRCSARCSPSCSFYAGVKRIGAARATTFAFLVPIFGVVSSVIMLGECLSASTIAGGALVLVGLWLVQRQPAVPAARLVPSER